MAFDPRPGHHHTVTMICSAKRPPSPLTWDDTACQGILLQYNVTQDLSNCKFSDMSVSSGCLEFFQDGQQFLVAQNETDLNSQFWGIYQTDSLRLVQQIDLSGVKFRSLWRLTSTHVLPVYSACSKYLSLGFWSHGEPDTDLITVKLPYPTVISLQLLCRAVIVRSFKPQAIQKLPLPKRLLVYLSGRDLSSVLPSRKTKGPESKPRCLCC